MAILLYTDVVEPAASPEDLRRAHYRVVRDAAGGREVRNLGEGLMVVFESAEDAIRCAMELQAASTGRGHDAALPVRVGLNTGDPIADEEDLFGAPVVRTRRLCAAASGGQVLASEAVIELAPPDGEHTVAEAPEVEIRGGEPMRAFEVSRPAGAEEPAVVPPALRAPGIESFVGREADLEQLRATWAGASEGQRRLVFVAGEPGMGKTSLALRLAQEIHDTGGLVLYGRCDQQSVVPFQPFVEATGGYCRSCSERELSEIVAPIGSELSRLLPDLLERLPRLNPPPTLTAEDSRYRLFDAVRRLLQALSSQRPVLLVLDDLHWADRGSLLLLQFIVRELPAARLMILGAYRDSEVDRRHPLSTSIGYMRRSTKIPRIGLEGLTEADIATMVERASGHALGESGSQVIEAVHQGTGGHPLYVLEVIRHLSDSDRLRFGEAGWVSDIRTSSDIGVPEGVQEAIRLRLSRMSPECARTLPLAAAIGSAFTLPALRTISGLDEDRLIDVLEEAVDGHLVEEVADAPGAFTFAHGLVRDALYGNLAPERRAELHREIAESLGSDLEAGLGRTRAAEVAYHLVAAAVPGDEDRTARYLELAGDAACDATAFEDALRYYQQALATIADEDHPSRPQLMFQVGLAQRNVGDWEPALDTWRVAIEAARRLDDAEMVGRIAWGIAYQFAWNGRYPECVEIAGLGIRALGDTESPDRCRLLAVTGSTFSLGGNFDIGEDMTASALKMADGFKDNQLSGDILAFRAAHLLAFWKFGEALDLAQKAARINRQVNDQWGLANNLGIAYFTATMQGHSAVGDAVNEELRPLADHLNHHGAHLLLLRADIARAAMRADLVGLEKLARREIEVCEEAGFAWTDASHVSLANAAFWRGDWDAAVEELRLAGEAEQPSFVSGLVGGTLFRQLAYMGREDDAMEVYRQLRHDISDRGKANAAGRWVALMRAIEGFWVMGKTDEAAALLPTMDECLELGTRFNGFDGSSLDTIAGVAAAAAGRWDDADAHFDRALSLADASPHLIEQADVRRFRAQMLMRRGGVGDPERARTLLAEAEKMYRDRGMARHADLAASLVR